MLHVIVAMIALGDLGAGFVTILVAAFGGGLLGSTVQPLIEDRLERSRTNEAIRKRRHARLRRMLESDTARFRKYMTFALLMLVRKKSGSTATPEEIEQSLKGVEVEILPLEPHRIDDKDLRALADELAQLNFQFGIELTKQAVVPGASFDWEKWLEFEPAHQKLREAIIARMDALNWVAPDDEDLAA